MTLPVVALNLYNKFSIYRRVAIEGFEYRIQAASEHIHLLCGGAISLHTASCGRLHTVHHRRLDKVLPSRKYLISRIWIRREDLNIARVDHSDCIP